MSESRNDGMGTADIIVVGPVPPPVTGRSIVTQVVRRELENIGASVHVIDIGLRDGDRLRRRLRLSMDLLAVYRALRHSPTASVYLVADDGWGLLFSCAAAAVSRLGLRRLDVHHHSFAYLRERSTRMTALVTIAGTDATHWTNAASMTDRFRDVYPGSGPVRTLSNAFLVPVPDSYPAHKPPQDGTLVLGHMSNLCKAKGIEIVESAFLNLLDRGLDVRLLLGGPPVDDVAKAVIDRLEQKTPRFEYLGPLGESGKSAFFGSVHLFLFPSFSETTALVLLESTAAGVPAVALRRGCIDETFYPAGVTIVGDPIDFVITSEKLVRSFTGQASEWVSASKAAWRSAVKRHEGAQDDLRHFIEAVTECPAQAASD